MKNSVATFGSGRRSAVGEKSKKRGWSQATIKLTLRLEYPESLKGALLEWSHYEASHTDVLTGWQRGFPWREMGPKLWASCLMIRPSSVMGDLQFSQRVTRDFPLKFSWWLISFETKSRDWLKIDSYDPNFLPLFLVPRPLISWDQMIQ